jgi:hypothetical protein
MKNLLIVLTGLIISTGAASAGSVLIDRQPDLGQSLSTSRYRVNPDLGRAWLVLDFTSPGIDPDDWRNLSIGTNESKRTQVPGLSYDAANSRIVFAGEKKVVTCAGVVARRNKLLISPTGHCYVRSVKVVADVDDGFEIKPERFVETTFYADETRD